MLYPSIIYRILLQKHFSYTRAVAFSGSLTPQRPQFIHRVFKGLGRFHFSSFKSISI